MTYENENYDEETTGPEIERDEWIDRNKWFNKDPVLRAAAIETDNTMGAQGVVPGRKRLNMVEDSLRQTYPERFYDVPSREAKWTDISSPADRREAKMALKAINKDFKLQGKKQLSEARYLKDYLKG